LTSILGNAKKNTSKKRKIFAGARMGAELTKAFVTDSDG